MISFNDYQKLKSINFLATECFHVLCEAGIDPNEYVEWLYKNEFQVNENQINHYIGEKIVKLEAAPATSAAASIKPNPVAPASGVSKPNPATPAMPAQRPTSMMTPLQQAMKDPARQGMVNRALQSLQVLQKSMADSIKRGGILGKQADLNKLLSQTINAVTSLTPSKLYAAQQPKAAPAAQPEEDEYTKSYRDPNQNRFSDHYEQPYNKKLLKEWIKTESLLKANNIDVKTFLNYVKKSNGNLNEAFGSTLDALGSGAVGAVGGLLSGGFKGMVRGAKAGYHASLDKGEINAMQDAKSNLDILIQSLPDKNAPIVKQLQAFNAKIEPLVSPQAMAQAQEPQAGEETGKQKAGVIQNLNDDLLRAYESVKAGKEPEFSMIKDPDMKQEMTVAMKRSFPLKDGFETELDNVKYYFKDKKWTTRSVTTGNLEEVADKNIVDNLNKKYPPEGESLNEFWKEFQDLINAEKSGALQSAMTNLHNRLQKIRPISDKLRNYLMQLLQGKNESVYYTMDYSKYVSDLING